MKATILTALVGSCLAAPAAAEESEGFKGPGRFCGYSAIIDLRAGERIIPTGGGIHGGAFIWRGSFGELEVMNLGWAAEPTEEPMPYRTGTGQTQFPEVFQDGRYLKRIWDRAHGTATFRSKRPLTKGQLAAIDRVGLFTEGGAPENCNYRTVFSWDLGGE